MDTFEDLIGIDDKIIQLMLRDLSEEDVLLALKGASPGMQDKILRNLQDKTGELLKKKVCAMEAVRLVSVEKAQQQFLRVYSGIYDAMMQGI